MGSDVTKRRQLSHTEAVPAAVWSTLNRVAQNDAAWVNFRSSPGWGNTTLLHNLKGKIEEHPNFRDDFVVSCVSQRDAEGQWISELGPIGNALYQLDPQRKLRGIPRLISRFKNLPVRSRWKLIGKQLIVLLAATTLSEIGYLLQSARSWWWLATNIVLAIVGAHVVTSRDLPDPEVQKLDPRRVNDYKEPKELVQRLRDVLGKPKRIIMLIDDLDHLPKVEFTFLKHLIAGKGPLNAVQALRAHSGVLIVSVDPSRAVKVPSEVICEDLPDPGPKRLGDLAGFKEAGRSKADERARAVLARCGAGAHGSWGLLELLAVCVTDLENARTETDWISILSAEGDSPLGRHIQALGARSEDSPRTLISELAKTALYRCDGRSLYRDRQVAAALRTMLEEQYSWEIQQAHLFWHRYYATQKRHAGDARLFKHAVEAAKSPEEAIRVAEPEELLKHLNEGAQTWRFTGDVELSSDALKAGRNLLAAQDPARGISDDVLGGFAAQWAMLYSLAALPARDCTSADASGGLIERLRAHAVWGVHRAQVDELVLAETARKIDDGGMSSEIQNLSRSTYAEGQLRPGGFDYTLADLDIPDPAESPWPDMAEFDLYRRLARAARRTDDLSSFKAVMKRFKARLAQTRPPESQLGLEAVWLLGRAIHIHALQAWWAEGMRTSGGPPASNPRYREMCEVAWDLSLEPLEDPATALAAQTKAALERALGLTNLCSLNVATLSAVCHLASLLDDSPTIFRSSDQEWWLAWDHIFEVAIHQCQELGLLTFECFIRWSRFSFFKKLDIRSSAVDALRFYEVASISHYAARTMANWNAQVRDLLTGYEIPPELHLSLAKLWLDWVDLLKAADWIEQSQKEIEDEQIVALVYAAQSFRFGNLLRRAAESLTRAAALLNHRYGPSQKLRTSEVPSERLVLRDFYRECKLLHDHNMAAGLPSPTSEDLWRMLRPGDSALTEGLDDLLGARRGLMSRAWDTNETCDPINRALTLVSAESNKPSPPATYFEFHLRLFLGWLTGDSYTPPDKVGELARQNWEKYTFPERVIFKLAKIGGPIKDIPELDRLNVALLREAYYQVANLHPNDRAERESLELLMDYEPRQPYWRELYGNVCQELADLIRREAEQMQARGQVDYVQIAMTIQEYLGPLENPEVRLAYYKSVEEAVRERISTNNEAATKLASGETMECWNLLEKYLTWPDGVPATILQLHMVHMARECALKEPSLAAHVTPLTHQLEDLLVKFAQHFVKSISAAHEKEVAERVEERVLGLFRGTRTAAV